MKRICFEVHAFISKQNYPPFPSRENHAAVISSPSDLLCNSFFSLESCSSSPDSFSHRLHAICVKLLLRGSQTEQSCPFGFLCCGVQNHRTGAHKDPDPVEEVVSVLQCSLFMVWTSSNLNPTQLPGVQCKFDLKESCKGQYEFADSSKISLLLNKALT